MDFPELGMDRSPNWVLVTVQHIGLSLAAVGLISRDKTNNKNGFTNMHRGNGIRGIFQEMKIPNLVYPELKSLEPAIGGFQVLAYNYNCLTAAGL